MDEIGILPLRPRKGPVLVDEIGILPFHPREGPVFMDRMELRIKEENR